MNWRNLIVAVLALAILIPLSYFKLFDAQSMAFRMFWVCLMIFYTTVAIVMQIMAMHLLQGTRAFRVLSVLCFAFVWGFLGIGTFSALVSGIYPLFGSHLTGFDRLFDAFWRGGGLGFIVLLLTGLLRSTA